jgi:hypothetical protein
MSMKRMKRTITGMEAIDRARFWLDLADGNYDDAAMSARKRERSRQRRDTVVAAIRMLERWELERHRSEVRFAR